MRITETRTVEIEDDSYPYVRTQTFSVALPRTEQFPSPVLVHDLEDDVDIPRGATLRKCATTGKYWLVAYNSRLCPDCNRPLTGPEAR